MPEHIEMQTERLLLRPFNLSDVDDVYAHASDPEWGRFLPLPDPYLLKDAELHYAISRAHWGKGMMGEAATAVINWAFTEFELVKVGARAELENRQSWGVMEKLGMTREGVLRSTQVSLADPSRRQDTVYYSILREEWERRSGD